MRVSTITLTGAMLVTLTAVAACGSSGGTAAGATATTSQPAVATTTTVPMTTPKPTTPKPTTTPRTTTPVPVGPASFQADLTIQRAGLGLLTLTNTGKRATVVRGWPTLAFLNAANETVAVPMRKVAIPGAGPSITIGPGETAFAGVRWVTGDKADPKTFVATSLRLTPPGGTKSVNVRLIGADGQQGAYIEFDLTSAQIGTLQPSSQGVLVF
ncbi:MAG TPA: DUF4232 domain-containing protein [Pseudonocardiaceae bacterium]|nr:DUF4232 domain-containing protein [Pseudonocardiaceae bacterium]